MHFKAYCVNIKLPTSWSESETAASAFFFFFFNYFVFMLLRVAELVQSRVAIKRLL